MSEQPDSPDVPSEAELIQQALERRIQDLREANATLRAQLAEAQLWAGRYGDSVSTANFLRRFIRQCEAMAQRGDVEALRSHVLRLTAHSRSLLREEPMPGAESEAF